ncbi:MAG: hypothetical protein HY796_01645 [Elusimicrobia bacterium]|nr:hypothetical protein [Elusimicrobiota bacterium]
MQYLRLLLLFLLPGLAGSYACARESVFWNAREYAAEFKYFQERGSFNPKIWAALTPEAQERALLDARRPALERQAEIQEYHADAVKKWDSAQLRDYAEQTGEEDIRIVRFWLGNEKAEALARKLAVIREKLAKAGRGLNDRDALALEPYLLPEAIAELRPPESAAEVPPGQNTEDAAHPESAFTAAARPESASAAALDKFTAEAPSALNADSFSRLYDGMNVSGGGPVAVGGARYSGKGAAGGLTLAEPQKKPAFAIPELKAAPGIKTAPPEEKKSTALTSDAYGITVYVAGSPKPRTFRQAKDAQAAIRRLPDGSISKIILYGHGSPGMQTVGAETYDAESAAQLLKGKMARGGVIQFSGCNTASIGGPTLNPAVGLSMVARRLLYFSLPYFQDRADGLPAAQAKRQWEKTWNADLALDTSLGVKGAIVCGYRTFGLVPGRLPLVTRIIGNQEATTPGYVAGKKACYQDGREVSAP